MDHHYGLSLDLGKLLKKEEEVSLKPELEIVDSPVPEKKVGEENDEMPFWFRKYACFGFVLVLVFLSVVILSTPSSLSNIDVKVGNSLALQYRQSVLDQIGKDSPGLSDVQKNSMADSKVNSFTQSSGFGQQVKSLSDSYKNFYRDSSGQTYLYSNDPYYFFRLARNVVSFGMLGDMVGKDGVVKDSLRFFPFGDIPGINVFPYVLAYFFKFVIVLFPYASVLSAIFYFPVFVGVVSVVLLFFLARKFSNDFGGFLTAFLFLIQPVFLFWNYAGYPGKQVVVLLWSLLSVLLFVFMIDFSNKKFCVSCFFLLFLVLYFFRFFWDGWFFVPVLFVCFVVLWLGLIFFRKAVVDGKKIYFLIVFFVVFVGFFVAYFFGLGFWSKVFSFINSSNESGLFPTAYASVTELEGSNSLSRFVVALGGSFVFLVFCFELFFVCKNLLKRTDKYELFPVVWFFLMLVPAFKASRFLFFVLPPFVLVCGKGFLRLCVFLQKFLKKVLKLRINYFYSLFVSFLVVCVLIFFVVNPDPFVEKTTLPSVTKSIVDAADFIRLNSGVNSVISTWWDNGYAFENFARRPTFFDGGLFNTERLYWTSKMLSSSNENVSVNSLRIMSCGYDYTKVKTLLLGWVQQPGKMVLFDKFLGSNNQFFLGKLNISSSDVFCNSTNDVFVVVSEDMIYKLGLFEHYANWDFQKAVVRNAVRSLSENDALRVLEDRFNMSVDEAQTAFFDVSSFSDSVLPAHVDSISDCAQTGADLLCDDGFSIDTVGFNASYQGVHPKSLVFVKDQKKVVVNYADSPMNFSIVVYSSRSGYRAILMDSDLVKTVVVRMFVGESISGFDQVFVSSESPQRVVVYKLKPLKK